MNDTKKSKRETLAPALKAGLAYFVIVFSCGFLLGTFRVLLLIPAVGERIAVLSELPVILGIAWISSRLLIARFGVAAALIPRLSMGGLAFGLLMICEFITGIFAFGLTFSEQLASFRTESSLLGLCGQIAFAIFPVLHLTISRQ